MLELCVNCFLKHPCFDPHFIHQMHHQNDRMPNRVGFPCFNLSETYLTTRHADMPTFIIVLRFAKFHDHRTSSSKGRHPHPLPGKMVPYFWIVHLVSLITPKRLIQYGTLPKWGVGGPRGPHGSSKAPKMAKIDQNHDFKDFAAIHFTQVQSFLLLH